MFTFFSFLEVYVRNRLDGHFARLVVTQDCRFKRITHVTPARKRVIKALFTLALLLLAIACAVREAQVLDALR